MQGLCKVAEAFLCAQQSAGQVLAAVEWRGEDERGGGGAVGCELLDEPFKCGDVDKGGAQDEGLGAGDVVAFEDFL